MNKSKWKYEKAFNDLNSLKLKALILSFNNSNISVIECKESHLNNKWE